MSIFCTNRSSSSAPQQAVRTRFLNSLPMPHLPCLQPEQPGPYAGRKVRRGPVGQLAAGAAGKETVLRRLAQAQDAVMPDIARNALREADMIADLGKAIRRLTKRAPSPEVLD